MAWLLLGACLGAPDARAGERYDLDGARETALLSTGVLTGLLAMRLDADQLRLSPADVAALDASRLRPIDRSATRLWSPAAARFSDYLEVGLVASPFLLLAGDGTGADAGEVALMYGETLLIEQTAAALLKACTHRVRPYAYNADPAIPPSLKLAGSAVHSFPSGHAATSFAAAVFTGDVYARLNPEDPARHWVRWGTLTLAAGTGWLRVRAGRHFPTDVLAGAAVGALIGWAVPHLHEVAPTGGEKARAAPALMVGFRF